MLTRTMINRNRSSGRTPLFAHVRKWMRMAHAANQSGRPVEDVIIPRASGISRRRVIKAAGAAVAALALRGNNALAATAPRIAIVGGGMAGLNACYQLKKKGFRADIYEGSNRTSGRMLTARGTFGGNLTTELGGEFVDSIHDDMFALCDEFGLELRDFASTRERTYETTYYFSGNHFTEAQVVAAFQPIAEVMAQDQEDFIFDSYRSYNDLAFDLDHTSIAEYLAQAGARGWIYDLLDVAYNIEYGLESDEQSALNLLYLIGTDTSDEFALYGESDERFTIVDGNDTLTSAIASQLDDRITLGHRLIAIQQRGSGFRLTFQKPGGGTKQVDCDFCLLALPFTMLREVDIRVDLPDAKQQAIDQLGYGTNAKLILGFNKRFWRDRGLNGEWFSDNGLQSGWDSSRLQNGQAGSLTCYSGGNAGLDVGISTKELQRKALLPLLDDIFPGAAGRHNGRVVRFHWPTNPWTIGSYAAYRVGQFTQFSGAEIENVGRLFFAGEHCSSDFQGYMNGAAETGRRAANHIWKLAR